MGPKGLGFCPLGPSQLSCRALCLPGYLLLFRDSSTWMGPVDVKEKREAPAGREGHPVWGRHLQGSSSRQLPSVPLPSRPWRASQDHHLQDPLHPPEGPPPAPLLLPGLIPPSRPSPRPSRVAPLTFRVPLCSLVSSPLQGPCPLWAPSSPNQGLCLPSGLGPPPSGTTSLHSGSLLLPGAPLYPSGTLSLQGRLQGRPLPT